MHQQHGFNVALLHVLHWPCRHHQGPEPQLRRIPGSGPLFRAPQAGLRRPAEGGTGDGVAAGPRNGGVGVGGGDGAAAWDYGARRRRRWGRGEGAGVRDAAAGHGVGGGGAGAGEGAEREPDGAARCRGGGGDGGRVVGPRREGRAPEVQLGRLRRAGADGRQERAQAADGHVVPPVRW